MEPVWPDDLLMKRVNVGPGQSIGVTVANYETELGVQFVDGDKMIGFDMRPVVARRLRDAIIAAVSLLPDDGAL